MEEPKTPPTFEEPVAPQEPFPRPADQAGPEAVSLWELHRAWDRFPPTDA